MKALFGNIKFTLSSFQLRRHFSTQDKSNYNLAVEKYKKGVNKRKNRKKFYTFLNYLLAGCFGGFYLYYIGKASGLFNSLKLNNKYKEHVKNVQEKHNINQEIIDQKIREFDEKYEINKPIVLYEEKLKYGNKELNERAQSFSNDNEVIEDFKENEVKTIDLLNKASENKEERILIEEESDYGENIIYSKSNEYEQLKVLQTSEENNPDPRIMGNTIIFDSRFNLNSGK
jgi:hypothetical protein